MSLQDPDVEPRRTSGLLASSRRLLATFVEILHTRLEIATTELQEAGEGLGQLLLYALAALFFTAMGILLVTFFIIVLFWDSHPLVITALLALLYLGLGAAAGYTVYQRLKSRPRLFATTLNELRKDRVRLTSEP